MNLTECFIDQAGHCERLGSPFMGRLLRLLAAHWPNDTAVARKFGAWKGDIGPGGASLPLRLAGGMHALVLGGQDTALAAVYPPNVAPDDVLLQHVLRVLHQHDAFLDRWTESPPQTNEVRRSAAILPAALMVEDHFGLPLRLSELGASGGLNLICDKFALTIQGKSFGSANPVLTLEPDWAGPLPPSVDLRVTERRGVDLNPVDATSDTGALRLLAYLWPDQPDRISRTRAAIAAQAAEVDKGDAIDWLEARLVSPESGQAHLIYHTIAWQYFPPDAQVRGTALIEAAGAEATNAAPLAWFGLEYDGEADGAAMTLRLWPGDIRLSLGRADFHGRWVHWATG